MKNIFLMEYMQSGDCYLKRRSRRLSPSTQSFENIKLSWDGKIKIGFYYREYDVYIGSFFPILTP